MAVQKFRSVEEMPPPWRDPSDPRNLEVVARLADLMRRLSPNGARHAPGVYRFRTIQEANAARNDPFRAGLPVGPSAGHDE